MRRTAKFTAARQASHAVQLFDLVIVGGCGNVGLPLAHTLAELVGS